jgi:hypothetical protein
LTFWFSLAARLRSEETMQSNHFDNTILGTIRNGQAIVVDGTHRSLRVLVALLARLGVSRLTSWRGPVSMKPAMAMCPSYSALRRQRHQRWTPGVVVGPGSVGVR